MKLTADITERSINLTGFEDSSKMLYFGFTDSDGLPVLFDNLKFGLALARDGESLAEESYPQDDVVYESTDQEFLVAVDLSVIRLGVEYVLAAWVENAGERWEASFDVTLPRWPQPYPSWIWFEENDCWTAPVPYPHDGQNYSWDEPSLSWLEVSRTETADSP